MAVANPALYVWLEGQQEREKGHPNPAGSPMGIPIRWEPGNRGKTPDRAVGSLGRLGYLTSKHAPSELTPAVHWFLCIPLEELRHHLAVIYRLPWNQNFKTTRAPRSWGSPSSTSKASGGSAYSALTLCLCKILSRKADSQYKL